MPVQDQVVQQVIALYKNLGWKSIFAKIRFWDAPYLETEKIIPKKGKIIELGCGEGLFSNFLALKSSQREIVGVDIDNGRVGDAQRGLQNTKYFCKNALEIKIKADVIVCMHLLHHLNSLRAQEVLLINCYKVLPKGGSLIIIEVEPKFSLKYFISWFTDHFLVPWVFEKRIYSPIHFRKAMEWRHLLAKTGFSCLVKGLEKGKPFTHTMFICKKK